MASEQVLSCLTRNSCVTVTGGSGVGNPATDRKKKTQTKISKILYRKQLFEQKHKQWSAKYYIENNYLSKNTNNGQQNTIQKTTI
jgi:hypothetical protein